jgi:hypothetical protein
MTVDLSELFAQFHGNGAFVGAGDVDTSFGGSGFSDFSDAERSRGFSRSNAKMQYGHHYFLQRCCYRVSKSL